MAPEKRNLRGIAEEVFAHPFFPLLFISETMKTAAVEFTSMNPVHAYGILAVVVTILWVLSDVPKEEIIGSKND